MIWILPSSFQVFVEGRLAGDGLLINEKVLFELFSTKKCLKKSSDIHLPS